MKDTVPGIQPRPAIVPAGSSRDPRRRRRRRRREREGSGAPDEPRAEASSSSANAHEPPLPSTDSGTDSGIGRAAPGEPGTNLDLTA